MPTIQVELGGQLASASGQRNWEIELAEGSTLRDLLEELSRRPGLERFLRHGDELAITGVLVAIGGAQQSDLEIEIGAGTEVFVMTVMAGG